MRRPPATAAASRCAVSGFNVIDEIELEVEYSSAPDYLASDGRIRWIVRHYDDDDDDDGMKIERKREEENSFGSLTRFHPPQEEEKKEKEMMKRTKKKKAPFRAPSPAQLHLQMPHSLTASSSCSYTYTLLPLCAQST